MRHDDRREAGKSGWGGVVLALALWIVAGCAESALATESPLSNARSSPEALAGTALDALEAGADSTLAALMITRDEYESLLWPEMPDGEYTPFEFIWSVTAPPSRKARRNMIEEFEGVRLELVGVDPGEEESIERYPSFTLYRDARMTVRRADTGEVAEIALMDAIVEMGGGWKFMNFRDDL